MTDSDLTVTILREIRDEIRGTNTRLDQTNQRIDQTNSRLDQTNARLEVVEHTVLDAAGQLVMLTRYVKNVLESSSTSGPKP